MSARETDLEEYVPRQANLLPQVPALILRHAQIRWSNWIAAQWGKTTEVTFPDLGCLWSSMDNQEPWEPTFPAGYEFPNPPSTGGGYGRHGDASGGGLATGAAPTFSAAASTAAAAAAEAARAAATAAAARTAAASAAATTAAALAAAGGGGGRPRARAPTADPPRLNQMAYNDDYVDGRWGLFRHAGAMRNIVRAAKEAGNHLPVSPIDPTCKACPAFHVKGMCNAGCGNAGGHKPHSREQDLPLWGWAVKAMPAVQAPVEPVE